MESVFDYLVPIATGIVAIVLVVGLFSLFKGGDFNRSWSNKLMRLRVVAQAIAIVIIMTAIYFAGR